MQIAVDLPEDFVCLQDKQKIRKDLTLAYALRLFKAERVTLSKGAEIAGIDLYDFMSACKGEKIPVIDVAREELLEEMEG